MPFFVDANVIVYAATPSPYRESCLSIVEAVAANPQLGVTSVAVLEEAWHIELSGRAGDLSGMTLAARTVFDPPLPITSTVFDRARSLGLSDRLGANDRIHVATCLEAGISIIVSADAGFDQLPGLRRIDPLNSTEVQRLFGEQQ